MLLVVAISFSALYVTNSGNFPFGTMFRNDPDATEMGMYASPSEVEARADFYGQTFNLTGLPEDDLDGIRSEHIFLGGYFANMSADVISTGGGVLTITVNPNPSYGDQNAVDWQDYIGGDGLIAIAPDAFSDRAYYYQTAVGIIYPQLSCDTLSIDYVPDVEVSHSVTLTLFNDTFSRSLSPQDIDITGGMSGGSISNLSQSGNTVIFTLGGTLDQNFDNIKLTISGGAMEKGLDISADIQKGRVLTAEQASSLYVIDRNTQTLDIFVQNDTFSENVNRSMLTFGGIMNELAVTGVDRIDSNTLRLTVNGTFREGTGLIVLDSNAFTTGRSGLAADVTVAVPQIHADSLLFLSETDPSLFIMTDVIEGMTESDLQFALGGSLDGMTVGSVEFTSGGGAYLHLSGTPSDGIASLKVSGLFEADANFDVVCQTTSVSMENSFDFNFTSVPAQVSAPSNAGSMASAALKLSAGDMAASFAKSAASSAGSYVAGKAMSSLFEAAGFPGFEAQTSAMLSQIINMISELSSKVSVMQTTMIRRFDELDYRLEKSKFFKPTNDVKNYIDDYQWVLSLTDVSDKDKRLRAMCDLYYKDEMTNTASVFRDNVKTIARNLNPYHPNGTENTDSLTFAYRKSLVTNTPFKHNIAELMHQYIDEWSALLLECKGILAEIYAQNMLLYPNSANEYLDAAMAINNIIDTAIINMLDYIPVDCELALQTLASTIFNASDGNYTNRSDLAFIQIVKGLTLILNSNGAVYYFADGSKIHKFYFENEPYIRVLNRPYIIGSVSYWDPYMLPISSCWNGEGRVISGYSYMPTVKDSIWYTQPHIYEIKEYGKSENEFFRGMECTKENFGAGKSFNVFMARYVDSALEYNGIKWRWWNPNSVFLGCSEYDILHYMDCRTDSYKVYKVTIDKVADDHVYALVGIDNVVMPLSIK
jgi:hypothetical protein